MPKYDFNDPTDLDIMQGLFNMISADEWDEYIAVAEGRNMSYKNVKILKTAQRKAGIAKYLSPKVISWILSLVDELDTEVVEDDEDE